MVKQCFFFVLFWERVSWSPCWPQAPYVAKEDLELLNLLAPSAKCWDHRHMTPHCLYGAKDWLQVLMCVRQAVCQLSYTSRPQSYILMHTWWNDCSTVISRPIIPDGTRGIGGVRTMPQSGRRNTLDIARWLLIKCMFQNNWRRELKCSQWFVGSDLHWDFGNIVSEIEWPVANRSGKD